MTKLLITPRSFGLYSKNMIQSLQEKGLQVIRDTGPFNEEDLAIRLKGIDALIAGTDQVTRKALEKADQLKVIVKYGVGIDNIDKSYAEQKGITVLNTPGVNTEAVADYTIGLMLSLARKIPHSYKALSNGKWQKFVGVELFGKTLGILGLGAIGKSLVKRAKGFNMQIIAFDLCPDYIFAKEYGIKYMDVENVLAQSDFVSIHLPLTTETKHLIGELQLRKMKKESMLINTARGGIVDEYALAKALMRDEIAGAALDVFEDEPLDMEKSYLVGLDNVILTPHNASSSIEAIKRMTEQSTQHVLSFIEMATKGGG